MSNVILLPINNGTLLHNFPQPFNRQSPIAIVLFEIHICTFLTRTLALYSFINSKYICIVNTACIGVWTKRHDKYLILYKSNKKIHNCLFMNGSQYNHLPFYA